MQSPIRKGDKLEHGGEVTGGSPWFEVMGRPLARKGAEAIGDSDDFVRGMKRTGTDENRAFQIGRAHV